MIGLIQPAPATPVTVDPLLTGIKLARHILETHGYEEEALQIGRNPSLAFWELQKVIRRLENDLPLVVINRLWNIAESEAAKSDRIKKRRLVILRDKDVQWMTNWHEAMG